MRIFTVLRGRRTGITRLVALATLALGAGLTLTHGAAAAADYPERPIKLSSPYAPAALPIRSAAPWPKAWPRISASRWWWKTNPAPAP